MAQCPNHQISEMALLQYFYEGLQLNDRDMLDAASGGCFLDKTQAEAKELISNRASNARHYAALRPATRSVSQVSEVSELKEQIAKLTATISKVVVPNQASMAQVCGICSIQGHHTDSCPQLTENTIYGKQPMQLVFKGSKVGIHTPTPTIRVGEITQIFGGLTTIMELHQAMHHRDSMQDLKPQ